MNLPPSPIVYLHGRADVWAEKTIEFRRTNGEFIVLVFQRNERGDFFRVVYRHATPE